MFTSYKTSAKIYCKQIKGVYNNKKKEILQIPNQTYIFSLFVINS